jgi:hypothetical protein
MPCVWNMEALIFKGNALLNLRELHQVGAQIPSPHHVAPLTASNWFSPYEVHP